MNSLFQSLTALTARLSRQNLLFKDSKKSANTARKNSFFRLTLSLCLLPAMLGWAGAERANAGDPPLLRLRPDIQVDAQGVYFDQIVIASEPFHIRLADSPAFGSALTLSRAQVSQLIEKNAPNLASTNWEGSEVIKITRQSRLLQEDEVIAAIVAAIQRNTPLDGQLEVVFTRPWTPLAAPADQITANIVNLPVSGITPNCIIRFELRSAREVLGAWSFPVQAHLWREVLVAQSPLRRGDLLQGANLTREKRDALVLRDAFSPALISDGLELTENVQTGAPLLNRSVRLYPVVQRGKMIDAIVQDGSLMITAKVQALEDGIPGQTIRVRNLKSGREFRGKVQNDQAVEVSL